MGARLDNMQGAIEVSLEAGWSQGKGESLLILAASLRNEATGRYELPLQGLAVDERIGSGDDRASRLKNCGDCENAGEQQRAATKRTATAGTLL